MSASRCLSVCVLGLVLASCSPEAEISQGVDEPAPAPTGAPVSDEQALEPLAAAARDACAEGDLAFVGEIPEGSGFVSRGPDARVHVAWRLDGEGSEYVIRTPELSDETRQPFDFAVADFMRHNMVSGFDRTGITGAFRHRDGRFCVVQTEREVIEALREATLEAAATL